MFDDKSWYKEAVFYELYVRAYKDGNNDGQGDLRGVIQKLDYLQELGIDCIWLLPIFPSPLKDDGYDINDYYGILPDYGSLEDFRDLVSGVHAREMRIILDLVINHTSIQHPWFQKARLDRNSPYRNYYVWSDSNTKYAKARIIFIDSEKSNWTWDEVAKQYYWHRFYSSQPDLNYDNPEVRAEILKIMQYWLDIGVDGFRVDAVPYLFEREDTNCENLPETHAFLKEMRRFIEKNYPGRILLCEANQLPRDIRGYFGDGDEFQMAFHFPLMPRLFMALKQGSFQPIEEVLEKTLPIPEGCQWCIFLRNHDELTLEMVSVEEREWMWHHYAPESRMRLNLGIRRRLAPLLDNNQQKIELAYSLLFTLPGSPVLYYGDEIGLGDNIWLDDRDGLRTPMQWEPVAGAGFSEIQPGKFFNPILDNLDYRPERLCVSIQIKDENSLLNRVRRMIKVRKKHPELGSGDFRWVSSDNPSVAAYWRTFGDHKMLVVQNLSALATTAHLSIGETIPIVAEDLIWGKSIFFQNDQIVDLDLTPFQYFWFEIPFHLN
jgi:maltose alpha-D-glucosyltransferase/alpha-amylase